MPNFTAHSKADVKHSDMFIDVLEKYVAPGREQDVLDTAKESMDLHRAYFRRHGPRDVESVLMPIGRGGSRDETRRTGQRIGEKPTLRILEHPRAVVMLRRHPISGSGQPLLDGLLKASETIGIEQAERRAIRLVSPHLPIKSTSHTLQFTFSIVNPGEVARAHRHNMAAIRFVVQGQGRLYGGRWREIFHGRGRPDSHAQLDLARTSQRVARPDYLARRLGRAVDSIFQCFVLRRCGIPEQPITRQTGESLSRMGFARPVKTEPGHSRGVPFRYAWKDTHTALRAMGDGDRDPYDGRVAALHQSRHRRLHLSDDVLRGAAFQRQRVN